MKVAVLLLSLLSLPLVALFGFTLWVYVRSSALVDARLQEARNRVPTRVYSRPVSVRVSDRMDADGFASILNALSYQDTEKPEPGPGEFRLAVGSITVRPRGAAPPSADPPVSQAPLPPAEEAVVVTFEKPKTGGEIVKSIKEVKTGKDLKVLTLEPALISYLF